MCARVNIGTMPYRNTSQLDTIIGWSCNPIRTYDRAIDASIDFCVNEEDRKLKLYENGWENDLNNQDIACIKTISYFSLFKRNF